MRDITYIEKNSRRIIGWIMDPSGSWICGTCGCEINPFEIEKGSYIFCPNCGTRNAGGPEK